MKDNKEQTTISKAIIDRLPIYYRTLKGLRREGIEIVSSEELGRINGITPEQIRKDLSTFGEFGKKGVGYYVNELMSNITEILGLDKAWNVSIVGAGHLGWALANYNNLSSQNFHLKALFDVDPEKVGKFIGDIQVYHNDEIINIIPEKNVQIGIITVPSKHAQDVANLLVNAGVKGIWNFAPTNVVVPSNVYIVNEDIMVGLISISYHLSNKGISPK